MLGRILHVLMGVHQESYQPKLGVPNPLGMSIHTPKVTGKRGFCPYTSLALLEKGW